MNFSSSKSDASLASSFYVSRSRVDAEIVKSIVGASRISNARTGLTGGMLFTGNYFAQVLEGPIDKLHSAMKAIAADNRHDSMVQILLTETETREYGDWTMGYIRAPEADVLIENIVAGKSNEKQTKFMHYLLKEWIAGGV